MDDSDVDLDFDTDELSLTSTRESDNDGVYDIECILSEGYGEDEKGKMVMKYLIKWENYAMHECTWEPEGGVKDIGLLEPWKQVKQRMGPDRFLEFIQDKERRFYKAHRRHHEGKPIRKAKRAMKRSKLEKRTRPVVEDGDSEDDTPLIQTKRAGLPNSNRRKDTITPSQASWNSLFVDSQDPNPLGPPSQEQGEGALFVTQSPVTRKAPLEQSSSEDEGETSVDSNSDDSLMGELAARGQRKTHKKTTRKTRANEGPDLGRSILSPKSPTEKQPVPPAKSALKKPVAREQHEGKVPNPIRKPTIPVAAMIPKVVESRKQTAHPSGPAAQASSAAPRKKSVGTLNRPESSATASARAPAMTVQPGSNALTRLPPKATSATAIRKTGSSSKSAINFTNEPKTSTRSEWQNGNGLFKKWSSKHRANVRGHVEAAPDFCSLEFVNHAPVGLVKSRSTNAADNPYGRRETGNRRVPEVDRYEPGRRGSADDVVPLQDWEANKAPLVCSEWRLSNNCQYGPVKCQFMHRNKDEHGKNLPLSLDGLPPKYRKPPLTCFFWMTSEQGCRKGAEECVYAHRNTGWMPKSESDKETSKIDPNDLPVSELQASTLTPHSRAVVAKDRRGLKPKELTCWYWTKGSCNKTPEACIHAHYDTGVIAKPPATATTTCEFWRKGYCRKTAAQCKYMHAEKEGQISANAGSDYTLPYQGIGKSPLESKPFNLPRAVDGGFGNTMQQTPLPPASTPILPVGSACVAIKQTIEQALRLNYNDLFEWGQDEYGKVMLERKAMLLYHPVDHFEELELVTRWLLMHHVEVSSAWHEGCWDHFRRQLDKGGSGIVIVHPDFEYYTELPGFGELLRKQVRLWSLGVQEGIEYDPALSDSPPKLRQDCIEVFPFGGFIYITDDVFENEPQLALQIVQLFFTKIDKLRQLDGPVSPWHKVDDCTLVWRLCVRPELMEYLFARCEEQQDALEAGDPDVTARAALYTLLSENDYIEQDSPVQPLSAISDKYPIMSERRIIAEEPPVGYFNTLVRNPEEANLRMIQYYAGLQVDMRRDYRHFFVVHTEPSARCARQWKQEIHSLADVISPAQCVAELSKSAEASGKQPMFDFCERYMPALQGKPETEAHVKQITNAQIEQVKSIASPQGADSQMSLDDGEIRETQQSLEDGEIFPTQEEPRR